MISPASIMKEIDDDNVKEALSKAQDILKGKGDNNWATYSVLLSLYHLLKKSEENGKKCKSCYEDIYRLAQLCCSHEYPWKRNRTTTMKCTFHIMRYLNENSQHKYAKQLCENYFDLPEKTEFVKWTEEESLVLVNVINDFTTYITKNCKNIINLCENDEFSLISWINFILKVNCLNNYDSIYYVLKMANLILVECSNTGGNKRIVLELVCHIFEKIREHFNDMYKKNGRNLQHKELIPVVKFLYYFSYHMNNTEEFLKYGKDAIINLLKIIKLLKNPENGKNSTVNLDLIENTALMCIYSESEHFYKYYKPFSNILNSKPNVRDTCELVNSLLMKFRIELSKRMSKDVDELPQFIKLMYQLYCQSKPSDFNNLSESKCRELSSALVAALVVVSNSGATSSVLLETYKTVTYFLKEIGSIKNLFTISKSLFDFVVACCINTICCYKKAELYKQVASLSSLLEKYLLRVPPESLPFDNSKMKIILLTNSIVTSYSNIGLGIEAQIALIALAGVHPQFLDVIFKGWADLKKSTPSLQKDTTCYDILTTQRETIEDKWSPCRVDSVDIGKFLTAELLAYSKHRELHLEPVIAVYKTAVKLVKDVCCLADILAGAIDCIASQDYSTAISTLELSLANVISALVNAKDKTEDRSQLAKINCALGNMFYHQVRCDIVKTRKKAEDEMNVVTERDKDKELPVVQLMDSQEDGCSMVAVYTYLQTDIQTRINQDMARAFYHWNTSFQIIHCRSIGDVKFTFRYLKGLAYLLRLHNYKLLEVDTWELIYHVAEEVSYPQYIILAVAELLTLKTVVNSSWLDKAKEELRTFNKENYVYSLFSVNLAKNAYLNGKIEECKQILEDIDQKLLSYNFLVKAQYRWMVFLTKRHSSNLSPGKHEATLYTLVLTFENLRYVVKNSNWNTFCEKCVVQWLVLEVSTALGKVYNSLHLIRQARCYTKKQLEVAQRLALPIRVCELLTVLSWVDMMTNNLSEAELKLSGLESILELVTGLETGGGASWESGSPTAPPPTVSKPGFLAHPTSCPCLHCIHIDYPISVLQTIVLRAEYALRRGNYKVAHSVYTVGKSLMKFIEVKKKSSYSEIRDGFSEAKVGFVMSLSRACAVWGDQQKALSYSKDALEMLGSSAEMCQRQAILSHMIDVNWNFTLHKYSPVKAKLFREKETCQAEVKTPDMKPPSSLRAVRSVFTTTKKTLPVSPRASNVRKLILSDFNEEESVIINGVYTKCDDKGNVEAQSETNEDTSVEADEDKSPLAKPLPASPKCSERRKVLPKNVDGVKRNAKTIPSINLEDWSSETPKEVKIVRTVRKPQSERKNMLDSLATPYIAKSSGKVHIYCDSDDEDFTLTTKRRGRPKTNTKRTTGRKAMNVHKSEVEGVAGRKLFFGEDERTEEIKGEPLSVQSSKKEDERIEQRRPKRNIGRKLEFDSDQESSCTTIPETSETSDKHASPVSSLAAQVRKLKLNDLDEDAITKGGYSTTSDKESDAVCSDTNEDSLTKTNEEQIPIVVPLPVSPKSTRRKLLRRNFEARKDRIMPSIKFEELSSETPEEVKTIRTVRKPQSERKNMLDSLATPYIAKSSGKVHIYCDSDDEDFTLTTKRRGRPKTDTKRTIGRKAMNVPKLEVKGVAGRKLFFGEDEEEVKEEAVPVGRSKEDGIEEKKPKRNLGRRLRFDSDQECSSSSAVAEAEEAKRPSTCDESIIETSLVEEPTSSRRLHLPLTPQTPLENGLKRLVFTCPRNATGAALQTPVSKIAHQTPHSRLTRSHRPR